VSTLGDLLLAGPQSRPTYLSPDLSALATAPVPLPGWAGASPAERSGWTTQTQGGRVSLLRDHGTGAGDVWDAVRAVVVAAWSIADSGGRLSTIEAPDDVRDALVAAGLPQSLFVPPGRDNGPQDSRG
jgi:hypothetical protein